MNAQLDGSARSRHQPGEMDGIGPIDPALARDLAAAAARSPRSTWCVTVTGPGYRPAAHGCGRPPPRRDERGATARDGPVYSPGDDHGPPGTGTIRLDIAALTGTTGTTGTTGAGAAAAAAAGGLRSRWRTSPGPVITSTRRRGTTRGSGCGT